MILGFTGTSAGMTQRQRATVRYLLMELQTTVLHHGDCIGADAEVHRDAKGLQIFIVAHPPEDSKKRAFCAGADVVCQFKPYLKRNCDIVLEGVDGLIAAPRNANEPTNLRGQGTWTTVGYARQAGRRIWIVMPDGTFKEEQFVAEVEEGYGHGI